MYTFTGIKSFNLTEGSCFICGELASSKEHIFPKWLQNKFNLWDKKIILPNSTGIPYRQITVPCCDKCNREVFSKLENRISLNIETETDIWHWANKIHFGLTLKDSLLDWDRRNPGYKIGDVISPIDPLEQSRHFLHCLSGGFLTDPEPFGSVFKFEFENGQDYDFIHLINSSSICISLGDRGYIIFVKDGNVLKDGFLDAYKKLIERKSIEVADMLFFYASTIEFVHRYDVRIPILITPGKITKLGGNNIRNDKPVNKQLLTEICKRFKIILKD